MKKINLKELGAEVGERFKYAALDRGGKLYVYEEKPYYNGSLGKWIVDGNGDFKLLDGVEESKLHTYSPKDSLCKIVHEGGMKKINLEVLGVKIFDVFSYVARDDRGDIYVYQYLPDYDDRVGEWFPDSGVYAHIPEEDANKIEPLLGRGEAATLVKEPYTEENRGDSLHKIWEENLSLVSELLNQESKEKDSLYFLNKATETQSSRAGEYDTVGEKERNMQKIVGMFNACTGKSLTEAEGYLFMECLKNVRLFNAPHFHEDSAVDGVSYSSLKAEAKAKEHQ